MAFRGAAAAAVLVSVLLAGGDAFADGTGPQARPLDRAALLGSEVPLGAGMVRMSGGEARAQILRMPHEGAPDQNPRLFVNVAVRAPQEFTDADLDGDGDLDAVGLLTGSMTDVTATGQGDAGQFWSLTVWRNDNGRPVAVGAVVPERTEFEVRRDYADASVKVERNAVVFTYAMTATDQIGVEYDDRPVTSQRTYRLQIHDGRLVEVKPQAPPAAARVPSGRFAGVWRQHWSGLTINADGSFVIRSRGAIECGPSRNELCLTERTGRVTKVSGDRAEGMIDAMTGQSRAGTPSGRRELNQLVVFVYKPATDTVALVTPPDTSEDHFYCGPKAAPGYCGA
jgi:hypothetical protein